jgi:hypothetical protein
MAAGFASPIGIWMGGIGGRAALSSPDTTAPTATLVSHPNVTGTASFYDFTVRFSDDVSIDVATFQTGNVFVTGPGGDIVPVLVSVDTNTNGTPRTATYRLTPPGGSWDNADNGTYHVWTDDPPLSVFDTSANPVATADIGTFTVTVPAEGAADGYYAKHMKMSRKAGPNNLASYTNLDSSGNGTPTEDETILQEAMDEADRYVDTRARTMSLTADAGTTANHMVATDNVYFDRISDLASAIAVAEVYRARGVTGDATNNAEGQMADMDKRAREELDDILEAVRIDQLLAAGIAGSAGMEVIAAPCLRPYGYGYGWRGVYP